MFGCDLGYVYTFALFAFLSVSHLKSLHLATARWNNITMIQSLAIWFVLNFVFFCQNIHVASSNIIDCCIEVNIPFFLGWLEKSVNILNKKCKTY